MRKTGFFAIVGRPNVGKSTLLNTILGEKVAIVSAKPQTTRNRITGIRTRGAEQYVFIDTPGIFKPRNKNPFISFNNIIKVVGVTVTNRNKVR